MKYETIAALYNNYIFIIVGKYNVVQKLSFR